MMEKITVPVVFCFFNRHDTTLRVFEQIRAARPERLCLISDGPRDNVAGEAERVTSLRKKVEGMIDWTDKVDFEYAPKNMGCGPRLASGIGNALNKYGRAIILEDDCLPTSSFFQYEQHLLKEYEKDSQVNCISGTYFLKKKRTSNAYGFTHFPQIWGWGAWARSWDGYEMDLNGWSDGFLHDIAKSEDVPSFQLDSWLGTLENIKKNPYYTWDIQFWLLCLKKRGISAFPYKNQITNIGYNKDATHTSCWWYSNKPRFEVAYDWSSKGKIDLQYEKYLQQEFYGYHITYRNFFNCLLLSAMIRKKRLIGRIKHSMGVK